MEVRNAEAVDGSPNGSYAAVAVAVAACPPPTTRDRPNRPVITRIYPRRQHQRCSQRTGREGCKAAVATCPWARSTEGWQGLLAWGQAQP